MKPDTILQLPMEKRAEMAFREAVEEVISEHLRLKLPIYVSRDGRVVELSPEEIHNLLASEGSPAHS
jgi:demethoxyubiquinone hydroxylase (CLK1/Coq7/Cat5 family)